MRNYNHSDRRFWLGIGLLIIGALLLLDNLNIIPGTFSYYIFDWRTLLLALGGFFLLCRGRRTAGIVLLALGTFFWMRELSIFPYYELRHVFWPAIIIAIGLSFILKRRFDYHGETDEEKKSLDYLDDVALFGGRERTINSQEFKGGKITAMFGGSQIDLRNADLATGTHFIDVFAMFGGTTIIVPPNWSIQMDVFSVLGAFTDKRYSALKVVPDADKVLIIKGFVMFGGGEVSLTH